MRSLFLSLAISLAAALPCHSSAAQNPCSSNQITTASCSVTANVSATINSELQMTFSLCTSASGSNCNTTLTAPRSQDFGAAAGVNSSGPTITIKANTNYTLTAAPANATWTGGGNNKPASDLRFSVGGGSFGTLGQVGQGVATAGKAYVIGYNTLYNWTIDKPGNYSLVVNYTLTSP